MNLPATPPPESSEGDSAASKEPAAAGAGSAEAVSEGPSPEVSSTGQPVIRDYDRKDPPRFAEWVRVRNYPGLEEEDRPTIPGMALPLGDELCKAKSQSSGPLLVKALAAVAALCLLWWAIWGRTAPTQPEKKNGPALVTQSRAGHKPAPRKPTPVPGRPVADRTAPKHQPHGKKSMTISGQHFKSPPAPKRPVSKNRSKGSSSEMSPLPEAVVDEGEVPALGADESTKPRSGQSNSTSTGSREGY